MELTTAAGVMAGGRLLLLLGTSSLASSKSPRGLLLVLGLTAGSGAGAPSSSSVQACVGVGVVVCSVFQYTQTRKTEHHLNHPPQTHLWRAPVPALRQRGEGGGQHQARGDGLPKRQRLLGVCVCAVGVWMRQGSREGGVHDARHNT